MSNSRRRLALWCGLLATTAAICGWVASSAVGAGTISGVVFQDFDSDGTRDTTSTIPNNGAGAVGTAVDIGVAGVTVTAFDRTGTVAGTATSDATGNYSLAASGTGPYRVEFTNLPTGYQPSFHGPNSGTTVQYVPDGDSSNVSLGVTVPAEYCQENPTLVTSCYAFGNQLGPTNTNGQPDVSGLPVVVSFPYSAGANSATATDYDAPPHPVLALANQVGTTWGLAYNRTAKRLYSAAFFKRHTGFGPGGPGAIYAIDPAGPSIAATFTVPGATTNAHDTTNYSTDNGNTGWDAVGKTGLGGLAMSEDDQTLYAMNLENRTLYALNPATGAVIASQAVPLTPPGCATAGDVRPFAVQVYRGQVYVGLVCSAESTPAVAANLQAYVYQVNPTTLAFGASPVFQAPLNYNRGFANVANVAAEWRPWVTGFASGDIAGANGGVDGFPQPMLTDIVFDNGNLVLGLRDRAGDQFGNNALDNPAQPATLYSARPAGETLRACGSPAAGWTLESNGRCAGLGTGPQNNGQGPGEGEYYFDDKFTPPGQNFHDEIGLGGLVQVPGFPDVASTVFDPIPLFNQTFDGGVHWWANGTGAFTKGYRVFGLTGSPVDLGKASGLGDLVALCDSAPIEIGNRVWLDSDNDGVQDPDEQPIAGVGLELVDAAGNVVGTTTTDATGAYYFNGTDNVPGGVLPNTSYSVRIPSGQGPLAGLTSTQSNADATGNGDSRDSDGVPGAGGFVVASITTGAAGSNDHTVDFGFSPPVSLGNQVFFDVNDDGRRDASEAGVGGVTINLYRDANGDGTPDGPVVATTTTNADGYYLFTGLTPGGYIVEAIPPAGYRSSTDIASTADPNTNVDSDDNGRGTDSGAIRSGTITVLPGTEPTGEGATPGIADATPDANSNVTVDFGLTRPVSLGNQVFEDLNDNGRRDTNESGIGNVTITLYRDANADGAPDGAAIATTTTNSQGYYLFTGLTPGGYIVEATLPPGFRSSTDISSSGDPNTNVDGDDNGRGVGSRTVRSGTVVLVAGGEPTGEGATPGITDGTADANSNLTVDFGFTPSRTRLAITKRANVRAQRVGGLITYTITVRNSGQAAARNVQICDPIPPGTQFVRAPGSRNVGGRRCWTRSSLNAGATVTVRITVRVTRSASVRILNTATVTSRNTTRARSTAVVQGIGVLGAGVPRPTG